MKRRAARDASGEFAEKQARAKTIAARETRERQYSRGGYQGAYEAWLVAADAYLEEGNQEKARYAKARANKIRSYFPSVSPPRYTTKQTQRIYKHLRRKGHKPKEALAGAKRVRQKRIIAIIGDRNPIDHDGGFVFRTPDGFELDYIEELGGDGRIKYIYRVDLDRTESVPNWLNADFYRTIGLTRGVFRKRWSSPSAIERARARAEVGNYAGWENLDSYPDRLTYKQTLKKYAVYDRERLLQNRSRIRNEKRGIFG